MFPNGWPQRDAKRTQNRKPRPLAPGRWAADLPLPTYVSDATLAPLREAIREKATDYARQGLQVVRLYGIVLRDGRLMCECADGATCPDAGKHPRMGKSWTDAASHTSQAKVATWWSEFPKSNVGLVAGANGWVIIDADLPNGPEQWAAAEERFGGAPSTFTVRTGSGSLHYYYRLPPGTETGNSLPALRGMKAKTVQVKGTNGYVVAAPSVHLSGRTYECLLDTEFAELPAWAFTGEASPPKSVRTKRSPQSAPRLSVPKKEPEDPRVAAFVKAWKPQKTAALPQKTMTLISEGQTGNQSNIIHGICMTAASCHFCGRSREVAIGDQQNSRC